MSQKQAKGRKKGGDDNIKYSGNEWEGYKGMWMECGMMSSGVECVW